MRVGYNPHKNQSIPSQHYLHQIVIPVYIPNAEGYFKDSLTIFKRCINSLLATVHDKTFITIVNNGSSNEVRQYIDALLAEEKIHETIHTNNIGKVNAVLKGLSGNDIPLLTITDADVLFLSGWQEATAEIFRSFPKAGIVGAVPQYRVFNYRCENLLVSHLLRKTLRFIPVPDPASVQHFHQSVGWPPIDPELLEYSLAIQAENGTDAFVGTGHFMATYRKAIFTDVQIFHGYLLGGNSVGYIDGLAIKKDLWRLSTTHNYAFHMGNVDEPWMDEISWGAKPQAQPFALSDVKNAHPFWLFLLRRVFTRLLSNKWFNRHIFYRHKGLPARIASKY